MIIEERDMVDFFYKHFSDKLMQFGCKVRYTYNHYGKDHIRTGRYIGKSTVRHHIVPDKSNKIIDKVQKIDQWIGQPLTYGRIYAVRGMLPVYEYSGDERHILKYTLPDYLSSIQMIDQPMENRVRSEAYPVLVELIQLLQNRKDF